ncbi:hypothetical protein LPB41_02910 [Thalassospira sp. MA62]|nr:hypothetical protein [Thalassospira sp. MA62]
MNTPVFAVADAHAQPASSVFCFSVHAAAEPHVMPRVLELFSKRNLVPSSWHATVAHNPTGDDELQIDIQISALETKVADHIARCLRQIVQVNTVLTSEKGYSAGMLSA